MLTRPLGSRNAAFDSAFPLTLNEPRTLAREVVSEVKTPFDVAETSVTLSWLAATAALGATFERTRSAQDLGAVFTGAASAVVTESALAEASGETFWDTSFSTADAAGFVPSDTMLSVFVCFAARFGSGMLGMAGRIDIEGTDAWVG